MWKDIKENRIRIIQLLFIFVTGIFSLILSLILSIIDYKSVAIGLISIAISSAAPSCIDKLLSLDQEKKFEKYLNGIYLGFVGISSTIIIALLSKELVILPVSISILGYISSFVLWWYQNRDNTIYTELTSALGGNLK